MPILQRHHVMDWWACNRKKWLYSSVPLIPKGGLGGFPKMICLLRSDLHCSVISIWRRTGGGVPNPFHGCLWTIAHTQVILSSSDHLISPYKISNFDVIIQLIKKILEINIFEGTSLQITHSKVGTSTVVNKSTTRRKTLPGNIYQINDYQQNKMVALNS